MKSLIVTVFFCLPIARPGSQGHDGTSISHLRTQGNKLQQDFERSAGPLLISNHSKNRISGDIIKPNVSGTSQNGGRNVHLGWVKTRRQSKKVGRKDRKMKSGRRQLKKMRTKQRNKVGGRPHKRRKIHRRRKRSHPFWETETLGIKIICQASDSNKCPHLKDESGWREASVTPNSNPDDPNWVLKMKPGVTVICTPENIKICKSIIDGDRWQQGRRPGYGYWKLMNGQVMTLLCRAKSIDECPAIQGGVWDYVKKKDINVKQPGNVEWVYALTNFTLYCDQVYSQKCAKFYGNEADWMKFYKNPELVGTLWKIISDGVTIICSATHVKHCPSTKVDVKWTLHDTESSREAKWINVIEHCTLYCDHNSAETCNQLYSQGEWRRFKPERLLNIRITGWWKLKKGVAEILCNADYQTDCLSVNGANWTSYLAENDDYTKNSQWVVVFELCTIYCNRNDLDDCIHLIRWGGWQRFPKEKYPKVIASSVGFWTRNYGYTEILCKADEIQNCPNIRGGGKWEMIAYQRDWSDYPMQSTMFAFCDNCNLYCSLHEAAICGDFYNGKWDWLEQPGKNNRSVGWWGKTAGKLRLVCVAEHGNKCPLVTDFGRWKPLKPITGKVSLPKDASWILTLDNVQVVCNSRRVHKCPRVTGSNGCWRKLRNGPTTPSPPVSFSPL